VSPARLMVDQLLIEQKRFWRNPASAVFTFAFPILFLVVLGSLNKGQRIGSLGNVPFDQFFTPNIVAFGLMSSCLVNLAINLPFRRDAGLLKRSRGTPLPTWVFMGGIIGNAFLVSAITTFIVMAIGISFYNVTFDTAGIPQLVLVLLIGAASFTALGVAIAGLIPNADAAPPVVNAIYFPLVFLSGTFFPISSDSVSSRIANIFPVRHFLQAIYALFDPVRSSLEVKWADLGVVLVWGAIGAVVAVRNFNWEPRTN
jgi:ABC-2 type transport system permease protein